MSDSVLVTSASLNRELHAIVQMANVRATTPSPNRITSLRNVWFECGLGILAGQGYRGNGFIPSGSLDLPLTKKSEMTSVIRPLSDAVVESRMEESMKSRISMLMFLAVLVTGHSLAQVETHCSTDGTSGDGRISTSTNCTSTDIGAEQRRQEAIQAERDRQNAEA